MSVVSKPSRFIDLAPGVAVSRSSFKMFRNVIFEDGLRPYADTSIDGITHEDIAHEGVYVYLDPYRDAVVVSRTCPEQSGEHEFLASAERPGKGVRVSRFASLSLTGGICEFDPIPGEDEPVMWVLTDSFEVMAGVEAVVTCIPLDSFDDDGVDTPLMLLALRAGAVKLPVWNVQGLSEFLGGEDYLIPVRGNFRIPAVGTKGFRSMAFTFSDSAIVPFNTSNRECIFTSQLKWSETRKTSRVVSSTVVSSASVWADSYESGVSVESVVASGRSLRGRSEAELRNHELGQEFARAVRSKVSESESRG